MCVLTYQHTMCYLCIYFLLSSLLGIHYNEMVSLVKYTLSTAWHGHYDEEVTSSMAAFVAVSSTKVAGFLLEYI